MRKTIAMTAVATLMSMRYLLEFLGPQVLSKMDMDPISIFDHPASDFEIRETYAVFRSRMMIMMMIRSTGGGLWGWKSSREGGC